MANIARPTKIWDQALNDWVFLAGVVDTTKSYTYTADQTFPGITATSYNGGPIVGRNKILNGDFSIWQRGTSFTGSGYTADRWYISYSNAPTTHSITRQAFAPGELPVASCEGQYYLRRTVTSAGSSTDAYLGTMIEDVRNLAGQTVTFSFWGKSDSSRLLALAINQVFGTSGSTAANIYVATFGLTSTWQRFSATVTIPSIAGKTIGAGSYLNPYFAYTPASGFVLDIWGVQLESGAVATPFSTNTGNPENELAACQRYYTTSIPDGYTTSNFPTVSTGNGCIIGWCSSGSTNDLFTNIQYAVPMRSTPSLSIFSASNRTSGSIRDMVTGSDIAVSGIGPQAGQNRGISYFSGMSATSNRAYGFHYVASAEL
jgi:hypothetical protein